MSFPSIPNIELSSGKKIFFLSDFHLGTPSHQKSIEREKKIVTFLKSVQHEAQAVFIVGDLFDFWFEYREVVPKGYVRILGQLAAMHDAGIALHFFAGNHDMWMNNYFQEEFNMPVYQESKSFFCNGRRFLVGHGDGLGPGDHGYKFLKRIFRNPLCRWLFGLFPPAAGIRLARFFSQRSRLATGNTEDQFLGEEKEWLVAFCREVLKKDQFDFFIFGHRHLPLDVSLNDQSRYLNLGDWIRYDTYAVFDGEELHLKTYQG